MYIAVSKVEPLSNYMLHLTFKGGEEKLFDMKPYLEHGIFKGLKDESMFMTATIFFDTVGWANNADIDPETLYEDGKLVGN